jgi:hypothetical protein
MTEKEAIEQLTSTVKWYLPRRSQSWASGFLARYKANAVKQSTIDKLLIDFGYEVKTAREWHKP